MASTKSKEVADEYISSLSDLTINSKPLINMLTMLAEDNIEHASAIVQAVETHLQKVRSEIKLPVLYLIDSIVKNVNGDYLNLFTQNIVNTFCGVFEKVDENTRASMWKLRQTWNDVFPPKKLFSLDVRVQSIDPAWPIISPPTNISSGSIHVNPRFFSTMPQQTATSIVPPVKLPSGEPVTTTEAVMREQLLKKQRELLELQKKKIELELLQAKASLEQQQRQLDKQAGSLKTEVVISTAHIPLTTEATTQGKPVAPVVPNQTPKQVAKQFPAATASLLKNAAINSGPRIAPASSIAVASAKPVSRDPRLKPTPVQEVATGAAIDPRQRPDTTSPKESRSEGQTQPVANIYVTSNQLKQLLPSKSAVTSTIKPPASPAGSDNPTLLNVINNNHADTNLNNSNNKTFSGNINKDAVSHRTSQKKDPRLTNNSSGNLNSSKIGQSLSICNNSSSSILSASNRGSGGSDSSKSKDSKSSNSSRGSSSSIADKSSTSSKSSHRKVGNKSRSKQPQICPSKIQKVDRDSSPVRSKSREKDSGDSSPSSRTSPQSSFQASKNRKKNMKSRKRSPSPPYRIPRRNDIKSSSSLSSSGGVTEEEQSGSLIVSPPHPPAFKEIRPNARQRNYVRRNKDDSLSPERSPASAGNTQIAAEPTLESSSKDEDLRASLSLAGTTVSIPEKKEDLDLRVLPSVNTGKRRSEDVESSPVKKTKAEKFDALFGNEDVDLRTLTHPKAGRPPTPPPPVISGEDGKDSWAKLKTPPKTERDKQVNNADDKRERDRNRDRLGRLRLYNKLPDDPKERRRTLSNEEQDARPGRRSRENDKPERNDDRNIEIIMKQAAEQLNQGSITKTQYNTLIQEVLHMSEDRKLRAAQRKEKEGGTVIWEKGINMDMVSGVGDRAATFSPSNDKEVIRNKEHPIPRNPNGPRWQNQPWQQPWAHPPGPPYGGPQGHFNSDIRPIGPWQNPRHFGPMRPDYQYHGGFNHSMGPNPRLGPGMMGGPIGPNGPIMSNLLPNGPMGPMGPLSNSPMTMGCHPAMMMNNGPMSNLMTNPNIPPLASGRNLSPNASSKYDLDDNDQNYGGTMVKNPGPHSRELSPPDTKLLSEISRDTMKSINIDNIPREIRYYGQTGVVFMNWDDPREIGFQDGIRRILIDDKDTITCAFNDQYKEFIYEGEIHRIKLGAPTRELYIDDRWYECYFGGMPITIELGGKTVSVKLEGPPPQVKIGTVKRTDLVVAKINLIINARNMVPVFLDAKPQIFEIEGKPHTLEFTDALQTVLLNGRPFKVEFGGLPKPIIVRDKKHFIRFSVLPRGVRAGHVKITGMRGESPIESPPATAQKPKVDTAPTPSQLPAVEQESTSQDDSDFTSTSKPDLQLDILSSVLPSAMAPSSGLSYEAEPVENPPVPAAPTLPLNMNELFQRLVETGIVPSLVEQKKQEEEEKKEPEITPVSFDKPETLKIKQPAIAAALYSGMQCSSCGARFAPELATRYSHHLDWHFRQNRRERDSARKAHSRPWYYDISDWIQFEEIEDLEDRAQSWFETEKQTAETEGMATDDTPQETLQPSVPTGNDEDSRCQVCHDAFEQFYNEEKEEWHLRPAVNYEKKNYHPLCLEDYKRALEKTALTLEEAVSEVEENKIERSEETPGDESKQEKSDVEISNNELEHTENSEQTEEKPLETVASETTKETPINTENSEVTQNEIEEKEKTEGAVEENAVTADTEENAPTMNEEEKSPGEDTIVPFENIKIKEEPLDDIGEQDNSEMFAFMDNLEHQIKEEPMEPEPELEPDPEQIVNESGTVDTTYAAMKSSIDGNVELDSTPALVPAAPSRIKINITKPLNTNKELEESKEKEKIAVETPAEENVEQPLIAASIKPSLQGRKLSNLPPVEKGTELSGLCSIM